MKTLLYILLCLLLLPGCLPVKDSQSPGGDAEGMKGKTPTITAAEVIKSGLGKNYFQNEAGYTCQENGRAIPSFKRLYHESDAYGKLVLGDLCSSHFERVNDAEFSTDSAKLLVGVPKLDGIFEFNAQSKTDNIEAWCALPEDFEGAALLRELALRQSGKVALYDGKAADGSNAVKREVDSKRIYVITRKTVNGVLTLTATASTELIGDVNNDGIVNKSDIDALSTQWLQTGANLDGDVNHDGIVNGQDIALIASHWLETSIVIDLAEHSADYKYAATATDYEGKQSQLLCRLVR